MKLYVCGSSSKGNCYIVKSKAGTLILDCGIAFREVQKQLNFSFKDLSGVLVTHEHKDHSKYITHFAATGINIYSSQGTFDSLNLKGHRFKKIKALEQFSLGDFLILPFSTEHDAREPLGFVIYDKISKEKLLYATDTYFIRYRFKKLNYLLLECNYIADILKNNKSTGEIHKTLYTRLLSSHFSLENVLEFLKANDLTYTRNIILCHLSDKNSDENTMINEIAKLTGITPIVADKNMRLELNLFPF